jgi:predicted RNA binding protein YcfA (HicA-like mRNA interferase family)
MSKLRNLTGQDVVRIFSTFGFIFVTQRGSHVKLRRVQERSTRQTLTVVLHDELDKGTLRAIFRQALRYIPESDLRPYFYTED